MNRFPFLCLLAAVAGCASEPISGVYTVDVVAILDQCEVPEFVPAELEMWDITFGESNEVTVETNDGVDAQCLGDGEVLDCIQQFSIDGVSLRRDLQVSWGGSDDRFIGNGNLFFSCEDDCGELNDTLPCTITVSVLGSLPRAEQ